MNLIATKMDAKGNCGVPVSSWDTHNLVWYLISSFRFQLDWYASSSFEVLYVTMFMESWSSSSRLVHCWITRLASICSSAMTMLSCSSLFSDGTMWHPLQLDHMHLPVLLCMVDPKFFMVITSINNV
jgi:hypothetical protein